MGAKCVFPLCPNNKKSGRESCSEAVANEPKKPIFLKKTIGMCWTKQGKEKAEPKLPSKRDEDTLPSSRGSLSTHPLNSSSHKTREDCKWPDGQILGPQRAPRIAASSLPCGVLREKPFKVFDVFIEGTQSTVTAERMSEAFFLLFEAGFKRGKCLQPFFG